MPLARVYAWGPGSGAWDQVGRWLVRWQSPWGGWTEVRSSSASAAPWSSLESARRALGQGLGAPVGWMLAPGDDAEHALLIARRTMGAPSAEVWALTTDQAPVAVQRPGGDAIPDIEGAVRIGGRWVLATVQPASELAATVVWVLDGSVPREVGRVPRAGFVARPWVRLARRGDGRAVGLVAEGQPGSEHGPFFWISSVDLETGDVGDPEPLAPLDLSDRSVAPCAGDDGGWEIELPYPGAIEARVGGLGSSVLQSTLARMKVSRTHACVEYLLSSADPSESAAFDASLHAPAGLPSLPSVRTIDVSVLSSGTRIPLRCSVR
jgi:hypothetical protein